MTLSKIEDQIAAEWNAVRGWIALHQAAALAIAVAAGALIAWIV